MANRHLARSIVLQTLYEWDFRGLDKDETLEIFERNVDELTSDLNDNAFMRNLLSHVITKKKELDLIITKAAPDWSIEKISIIDRNILRLGLTELLFADRKEVPPKVAINEAIELAKAFGGDTSGKFVNGVLGAVYKEMGEPGKNDTGSKKNSKYDIPDEEATIENLGGALVYSYDEDNKLFIALVHDVFGHWTLSKGKLEKGEDLKKGIMRGIREEIGLDVVLEEDLGINEYIAFHPEKGKLKKQVHYFLAKADFDALELEDGGGLDDVRWFSPKEMQDLNFYGDILPIVTKGLEILSKKR